MNICPECGKRHVVHWPEFWPYRRYNTYYCSFGCIDVSVTRDLKKLKDADRKKRERKLKKKDYSEIAREFIRIREAGGGNNEIYDYLEGIGYKDPIAAYYYVRKQLKKSDPELEAKIGNSKPGPAKKEAPEVPKMITDPDVEAKLPDVDLTIKSEDLFEMEERGFEKRTTVTAIRVDGLGEFYYDQKYKSIDWRTEGGDEVSMGTAWWMQLVEDLPMILEKLGVPV